MFVVVVVVVIFYLTLMTNMITKFI